MATFFSDGAAEPMVASERRVALKTGRAGIEVALGDVRNRIRFERAMSVVMTEELSAS